MTHCFGSKKRTVSLLEGLSPICRKTDLILLTVFGQKCNKIPSNDDNNSGPTYITLLIDKPPLFRALASYIIRNLVVFLFSFLTF